MLIFDYVGITFRLPPGYFAKRYSDIDLIYYSNSTLHLKFTEGRHSFSYEVSNVDAQCWTRALELSKNN